MHVIGGPRLSLSPPGRYVLRLLESRRESPSAMTFRFSTAGTPFRFVSTQAVRVALPGVDDPWGAARTFSLSSSPTEQDLISVTCRISDTPFKQALARLRPGETAEIYGPLGLFLLDPDRPSVFLAGGIGITPFRGMLRYVTDRGYAVARRLIYSARTPDELIFRTEIDALSGSLAGFRASYSVTRPTESTLPWDGRVGRIQAEWIREAAADLDRPKYYVAGLPEMVVATMDILQRTLQIPADDVEFEVFRGF